MSKKLKKALSVTASIMMLEQSAENSVTGDANNDGDVVAVTKIYY